MLIPGHYSKYVRPKKVYPDFSNDIPIVETSGYVPAQKRIENLIAAGKRLVDSRNEAYDLLNGEDDGDIDPTRSGEFDLADASSLQNGLEARFSAKKAADAALAAKAALETEKKEVTNG